MWVVHWRGRTWPRGPSDGGAPRLKSGGNPQKSSILRGACGSFLGRGDRNFAAALDYNTKRRPWPGLEPVGQRDRPCGTPARRPKSRESTNFGNLKVAPQSKSYALAGYLNRVFYTLFCRSGTQFGIIKRVIRTILRLFGLLGYHRLSGYPKTGIWGSFDRVQFDRPHTHTATQNTLPYHHTRDRS